MLLNNILHSKDPGTPGEMAGTRVGVRNVLDICLEHVDSESIYTVKGRYQVDAGAQFMELPGL